MVNYSERKYQQRSAVHDRMKFRTRRERWAVLEGRNPKKLMLWGSAMPGLYQFEEGRQAWKLKFRKSRLKGMRKEGYSRKKGGEEVRRGEGVGRKGQNEVTEGKNEKKLRENRYSGRG